MGGTACKKNWSHGSPVIHCLTAESSSSAADASSTLRVVIALGVADTATNRTYSSACDERLLSFYMLYTDLESASAMFFGPGWYLTLNLYGCILSTYLLMRAHGLDLGP